MLKEINNHRVKMTLILWSQPKRRLYATARIKIDQRTDGHYDDQQKYGGKDRADHRRVPEGKMDQVNIQTGQGDQKHQ